MTQGLVRRPWAVRGHTWHAELERGKGGTETETLLELRFVDLRHCGIRTMSCGLGFCECYRDGHEAAQAGGRERRRSCGFSSGVHTATYSRHWIESVPVYLPSRVSQSYVMGPREAHAAEATPGAFNGLDDEVQHCSV